MSELQNETDKADTVWLQEERRRLWRDAFIAALSHRQGMQDLAINAADDALAAYDELFPIEATAK